MIRYKPIPEKLYTGTERHNPSWLPPKWKQLDVDVKLIRDPDYDPKKKEKILNNNDIFRITRNIADSTRERFYCFFLDKHLTLLGITEMHIGTTTSTVVSPKDIFQGALLTNADGIIIVHNHPSGNPRPSDADKELTNTMRTLCEYMGISLIDSVVIGTREYYSVARDKVISEKGDVESKDDGMLELFTEDMVFQLEKIGKDVWQMTRSEFIQHNPKIESYPNLKAMLEQDKKVKVYSISAKGKDIRVGDYVTFNKKFAEKFGEVFEEEVSTRNLEYYQHSDKIPEFIYKPHKDLVEMAVLSGASVPDEVLADYPELVRKGNPGSKRLWQMTIDEYLSKFGYRGQRLTDRGMRLKGMGIQKYHKKAVEQALKEGKKVPLNVLENYPNLNKSNPKSLVMLKDREGGRKKVMIEYDTTKEYFIRKDDLVFITGRMVYEKLPKKDKQFIQDMITKMGNKEYIQISKNEKELLDTIEQKMHPQKKQKVQTEETRKYILTHSLDDTINNANRIKYFRQEIQKLTDKTHKSKDDREWLENCKKNLEEEIRLATNYWNVIRETYQLNIDGNVEEKYTYNIGDNVMVVDWEYDREPKKGVIEKIEERETGRIYLVNADISNKYVSYLSLRPVKPNPKSDLSDIYNTFNWREDEKGNIDIDIKDLWIPKKDVASLGRLMRLVILTPDSKETELDFSDEFIHLVTLPPDKKLDCDEKILSTRLFILGKFEGLPNDVWQGKVKSIDYTAMKEEKINWQEWMKNPKKYEGKIAVWEHAFDKKYMPDLVKYGDGLYIIGDGFVVIKRGITNCEPYIANNMKVKLLE